MASADLKDFEITVCDLLTGKSARILLRRSPTSPSIEGYRGNLEAAVFKTMQGLRDNPDKSSTSTPK